MSLRGIRLWRAHCRPHHVQEPASPGSKLSVMHAARPVSHSGTVPVCLCSADAQVFGRLQSKLFPLYFMLAIACLVLQLGTLAFGPGSGLAQQQLVTLGARHFIE